MFKLYIFRTCPNFRNKLCMNTVSIMALEKLFLRDPRQVLVDHLLLVDEMRRLHHVTHQGRYVTEK